MNCSPNYNNQGKQDVGMRACDKTCFFWDDCKKECDNSIDEILKRKEIYEN